MNKNDIMTYSNYIKEARENKNMTINDLAFAIDKNNIKKWERKIKKWENGKDYPDLNDIYKLAYVLEINPGEFLTIRNRGRKQFVKDSPKQKATHKIEEILDTSYYSLIAFARIFLIVAAIIFVIWLLKFVDTFYGGTAAKLEDKAITYQIDEYSNGANNVIIHK
jgi:transcriptional regulator with XRE-family HTH domain